MSMCILLHFSKTLYSFIGNFLIYCYLQSHRKFGFIINLFKKPFNWLQFSPQLFVCSIFWKWPVKICFVLQMMNYCWINFCVNFINPNFKLLVTNCLKPKHRIKNGTINRLLKWSQHKLLKERLWCHTKIEGIFCIWGNYFFNPFTIKRLQPMGIESDPIDLQC